MTIFKYFLICLAFLFLIPGFNTLILAQQIVLDESGWSNPSVGEWDPLTRTAILDRDLTETEILILADGITLDGNGHKITGTGTADDKINGIMIFERSGITVKNLNLRNYNIGINVSFSHNIKLINNNSSSNRYGIAIASSGNNYIKGNTTNSNILHGITLYSSSNDTLKDNTSNSNIQDGIFVHYSSDHNTLINNSCSDNQNGIRLNRAAGNNLTGNIVSSNRCGISIQQYSSDDSLTGNIVTDNIRGIILTGTNSVLSGNRMSSNEFNLTIWNSNIHSIDISNTVDSKPVYYLHDVSDMVIDASTGAGMVYIVNSENITVRDLTLTNNHAGIWFSNTTNSMIVNVTVSNNNLGIHLFESSNITVKNCRAHSNISDGIQLMKSDSSNITGNTCSKNNYGIFLGSHNTNIPENASKNNIITKNNILNNLTGLNLQSSSSNNEVYQNNFVDNNTHAYDENMPGTVNYCNLDTPVGGNYWSDWTSPDDNRDGFVDNPYDFRGVLDELPWTFMNGWLTGEQAIEILIAYVADLELGEGRTSALTIILENALYSLRNEKMQAAANKILAFVNQIHVLISSGLISAENGDLLIFKANNIIDRINSGFIKQGIFIPETYILNQNYPNPFNPETTIEFGLPTSSYVTLKVYDILGREIKTLVNEEKQNGYYIINWDGRNSSGLRVSSGIYFYIIKAGDFVQAKKMVRLK